jgi:hypothetical protein
VTREQTAALLASAAAGLCCCKSKDPSPWAVSLTRKGTVLRLRAQVTAADARGELLAVGTKDGRVLLAERRRGAEAAELVAEDGAVHDGPLRVVRLSRTGRQLLSVGGHVAAFWDTTTRRLRRRVRGPEAITAGALQPAGDYAFFGTARGHVLRWTPTSPKADPVASAACGGTRVAPARMRLPEGRRCPYGAYVEPDGQPPACLYPVTQLRFVFDNSLVRVCRTGEGLLVNLGTASRTYFSPGHLGALAPVGRDLALARDDGPVRLYSSQHRKVVRTYQPGGEPASALTAASELVVAARGRVLRVWHREHRDPAGPPVTLPGTPAWMALERPLLWVLLVDGRLLTYAVSVRPR